MNRTVEDIKYGLYRLFFFALFPVICINDTSYTGMYSFFPDVCGWHIVYTFSKLNICQWLILPAQTIQAEISNIKCFVCNDPLCHDYFM